jgi:hypothetical protein
MTKAVAVMPRSLDGHTWAEKPGVAVGGYPYYATAPGLCSVQLNRRVEEEQG